jgi:hypothetical protein
MFSIKGWISFTNLSKKSLQTSLKALGLFPEKKVYKIVA